MSDDMMPVAKAYHAACAADVAWQAELSATYGNRACDVRYTAEGRGEEGTALRSLYNDFVRASNTWREASRASILNAGP